LTSRIDGVLAAVLPGDPALPSYYRVADELRRHIASGELAPGARLPTEAELCRRYGLSRGTVIHALDHLERQGLIVRQQGRGTFVAEPESSEATFHILDFSDDMRRRGKSPASRLLHAGVERPSADVAESLALSHGELVMRIERLRLADDEPMALETRFLAYDICPDLLREDLESASIHRLLLEKFHLPLVRVELTMGAAVLRGREAACLKVKSGTPGLRVDRVTWTTGRRPVTLMRSLYRGDQYRLTAEIGPLPTGTDVSPNGVHP
jgi:GntR family transcriptional regulator